MIDLLLLNNLHIDGHKSKIIFLNHKVRHFTNAFRILNCLKRISQLYLIIIGKGGKIRNYGRFWLSSLTASMHIAGFDT